jgi:hypothetical protein
MTQCDLIRKYLDDFGSISNFEAMFDLGVGSLSKRICDLKNQGEKIVSEVICTKNRYGKKTHYTRYRRAAQQ